MSEQTPEQPIKWLLRQVKVLFDDRGTYDYGEHGYEDFMTGYNAVKRRYDLASRLRLARQELALFRCNQTLYLPDTGRYKSYGVKIDRLLERIKMLEAELDNGGILESG